MRAFNFYLSDAMYVNLSTEHLNKLCASSPSRDVSAYFSLDHFFPYKLFYTSKESNRIITFHVAKTREIDAKIDSYNSPSVAVVSTVNLKFVEICTNISDV